MWTTINIIVRYEENKLAAYRTGKKALDELIEDRIFDCYRTFYSKKGLNSDERDIPFCAKANSKEGQQLIDEGMRSTENGFLRNIGLVRKILEAEKNNKKLLKYFAANSKTTFDQRQFALYLHRATLYPGPMVLLYLEDGSAIDSREFLENILNEFGTRDDKWVVPANVHY